MFILVPPPPTPNYRNEFVSRFILNGQLLVNSINYATRPALPLIIDLRKHRLGIFPIKTSLTKAFFLHNIKKARTMVPKCSIQDPYAILELGRLAITDSEPPQSQEFFLNIHESRPQVRVP